MSPSWLRRLALPHRLTSLDVALTLLPVLFWVGGVYSRGALIKPWCGGENAAKCSRELVLPIDRPALGLEDGHADGLSYATQNLSGFAAIGVPVAWSATLVATRVLSPAAAAAAAGTDLVLLLQASAWNGLVNEIAHATVARPRPFVYSDPARRGLDPAHYTSFYSGHTSFSAIAATSLFLMLLARGASAWLLALAAAGGQSLVFMTAIFRVMAGRHFVSDVIVGAFMGTAIAVLVFWRHKSPAR
jgi:membrane-associated phospholipid phosphatase